MSYVLATNHQRIERAGKSQMVITPAVKYLEGWERQLGDDRLTGMDESSRRIEWSAA
jgi:hypothetical protein